jgi:hypothetical protein
MNYPAIVEAEVVSSPGPWQDGERLVVRTHNPGFPLRCIKTNEPVHGTLTTLKLVWVPLHHVWLLTFGALGHFIGKHTVGQTLLIQAPIGSQWLAKHKRNGRVGWGIIIFGVAGFVVGTVVSIIAAFNTAETGTYVMQPTNRSSGSTKPSSIDAELLSNIALAATACCPVIAIAGIVFLALTHKPILRVRNVTGELAWLDGVNRDFLQSLPEWPGPHLDRGGQLSN